MKALPKLAYDNVLGDMMTSKFILRYNVGVSVCTIQLSRILIVMRRKKREGN